MLGGVDRRLFSLPVSPHWVAGVPARRYVLESVRFILASVGLLEALGNRIEKKIRIRPK